MSGAGVILPNLTLLLNILLSKDELADSLPMSRAKNLKALTLCSSIIEITALHLLLGTINTVSRLCKTQPPARTSHFNPASVLSPSMEPAGASAAFCRPVGSNRARSLPELGPACDEGQTIEGCLNRAARSNRTRVGNVFSHVCF